MRMNLPDEERLIPSFDMSLGGKGQEGHQCTDMSFVNVGIFRNSIWSFFYYCADSRS